MSFDAMVGCAAAMPGLVLVDGYICPAEDASTPFSLTSGLPIPLRSVEGEYIVCWLCRGVVIWTEAGIDLLRVEREGLLSGSIDHSHVYDRRG
jgi:hypothetical protein